MGEIIGLTAMMLFILLIVFLIIAHKSNMSELEKKNRELEMENRMAMTIEDIFNIINKKAGEKAKNGDFKTEEEYRTYIYEHELPFVEMHKKKGWIQENGKRVYIGPNGEKY